MKIFDCFTFFNELDLLEIRLSELYDVVDHFVIVEGENTFQAKSKSLIFLENKERFNKYLDKIIHLIIPKDKMMSSNPWDNERVSFNYCLNGLSSANLDDVIMLSAVDEIPCSEVVSEIKKNPSTYRIAHQFFYFYLNTKYWLNQKNNTVWYGTAVSKFSSIKDLDLNDWFHKTRSVSPILNGGWHFSFLGDEKNAFTKVNSYSHSDYNYIDEKFYLDKIENLKDPFDRDCTGFHSFESIELLPKCVSSQIEKYNKYIRK